jgi:hypothetical protein
MKREEECEGKEKEENMSMKGQEENGRMSSKVKGKKYAYRENEKWETA